MARGTLDETRLGRADGRGALVRRRGCCGETAASTMHCNSQQPSVKTLSLALVLRVTTRAAGSGCLHCHGRGPAALSCTSQPETCPLCDYSSPSDWERTAVGSACAGASDMLTRYIRTPPEERGVHPGGGRSKTNISLLNLSTDEFTHSVGSRPRSAEKVINMQGAHLQGFTGSS